MSLLASQRRCLAGPSCRFRFRQHAFVEILQWLGEGGSISNILFHQQVNRAPPRRTAIPAEVAQPNFKVELIDKAITVEVSLLPAAGSELVHVPVYKIGSVHQAIEIRITKFRKQNVMDNGV